MGAIQGAGERINGRWAWAFAALALPSCVLPDGFGSSGALGSESGLKKNDGDYCERASDCTSELCNNSRLCAHSRCKCSGDACPEHGEPSNDCRDGWVCTDARSLLDPVDEFFGGEPAQNKGYCHPTCEAGCPEHYVCDGALCRVDAAWLTPQIKMSWIGDVEGATSTEQVIQLPCDAKLIVSATTSSAVDVDYEPLRWTIVDGSTGERVELTGEMIELSLGEATYKRVELVACDTELHCASLHVRFEGE